MHILHTGLSVKEYIYVIPDLKTGNSKFTALILAFFALHEIGRVNVHYSIVGFYETCSHHMTVFLITLEIIFLIVDTEIKFGILLQRGLVVDMYQHAGKMPGLYTCPPGYRREHHRSRTNSNTGLFLGIEILIYGLVYGRLVTILFRNIPYLESRQIHRIHIGAHCIGKSPVFSHTVGMHGNNTQQQKCKKYKLFPHML